MTDLEARATALLNIRPEGTVSFQTMAYWLMQVADLALVYIINKESEK